MPPESRAMYQIRMKNQRIAFWFKNGIPKAHQYKRRLAKRQNRAKAGASSYVVR
jgi:hypothetical protein